MPELSEIMDALGRVEKMMSNLAKPEAGEESHVRSSKEHHSYMLRHTLNEIAEDLAGCAARAARKSSPDSLAIYKNNSRRN